MKRYFPIVILLGCAAALVFGIVTLFELRFEAGDVYPEYSSLRADPLGTMALYESLEKVPGLAVGRDFSTDNRLPETTGTAYLQLGGDRYDWMWMDKDLFHEIQNFLAHGGRLVVTFYPETDVRIFRLHDFDETNSVASEKTNTVSAGKTNVVASTGTNGVVSGKTNAVAAAGTNKVDEAKDRLRPNKHSKGRDGDDEDLEKYYTRLSERWGLHTDLQKLDRDDNDTYRPVMVVNRTTSALPHTLAWHSAIVFTNCDSAWHVIYARGTNPVVLERKFGRGSVVMATDSYFVSNEAMTKDRHAELLAWLVGPARNIVFDESHFGIVETSGVAALMRKYRLHGLAAGLLLLAGLFIWKNSTSLVPPQADEERDDVIAGRDAAAGFVNLLRRSVAPRDLLAICFVEWKKAVGVTGRVAGTRIREAEAIVAAEDAASIGDRDPVVAYQKISETLGIRNKKL